MTPEDSTRAPGAGPVFLLPTATNNALGGSRTGAVDTDAGKSAQLSVPGVGSNSQWRNAPPTEKYWSQHMSSFSATSIEPRQPE